MARKTVNLKLVAEYTPEPDPPESNAEISLLTLNISVDENTQFNFNVFRAVRSDQVIDVDFAFINVSVTPQSGTIRFQNGITTVVQQATSLEVNTDELGTLELSNPRVVSGPTATPILVTPYTTSVAVNDTSSYTTTEQELRDLGYILPEDYGALGDNNNDDTAYINQAIVDGYNQNKAVWLSAGKTYLITDTIYCFAYGDSRGNPTGDRNVIHGGGGVGTSLAKAKVRLDNGAGNFGNPNNERPIFCWRFITDPDANPGDVPSDPLSTGTDGNITWTGQSNILFGAHFGNIDIDCGNNPGAFGVFFPAAQECFAHDITIDASLAAGGWMGLLGRNTPIMNLKVIGGTWQIRSSGRTGEGEAGICIAGLTLIGDARTQEPMRFSETIPTMIVGFDITHINNTPPVELQDFLTPNYANVVLVDGKIDCPGIAMDNLTDRNFVARNVYVTGTDDVIRTPSQTRQYGGTWKRVNEYVYNDQDSWVAGGDVPGTREIFSLIDGNISQVAEPIVDIDASVAPPTVDFVARHTTKIWHVDHGNYINIEDKGAVGITGTVYGGAQNTTPDARSAIQQAIDDAEIAGHNMVVIPAKTYYVGSPGLFMKPNTILIGTGPGKSKFACHGSWEPTSQVYVLTSADDANGTAHAANFTIFTEVSRGDGQQANPSQGIDGIAFEFDHFSWCLWRTGKNSSSVFQETEKSFVTPATPTNKKYYYAFSDNAGGKHYSQTSAQGRNFGHIDARVIWINNVSGPLHLYGCNMETSTVGAPVTRANMEVINSQNIRCYGSKREGHAPTLLLRDSQNFAFYGLGRQTIEDVYDMIEIQGVSDNLFIAPIMTDNTADPTDAPGLALVLESITGLPEIQLDFPHECASVYKRGTLNDALVEID